MSERETLFGPTTEGPRHLPLSALLAVRSELNQILPMPPSPGHLGMALIEEIGELVQALRDGFLIPDPPKELKGEGWRWWDWWEDIGRFGPVSLKAVLEELADILLLILLSETVDAIPDVFFEDCWTEQNKGWGTAHLLCWIQTAIIMRRDPWAALYYFVRVCDELGFDREAIEQAYLAKTEKNRKRWKGGER